MDRQTAKVSGRALQISTKQSIEICNLIRGMPLQRAKSVLGQVVIGKQAVPFKRFTAVGHRKGKMAAGRYPIKAGKVILGLLDSVEANAQFIGLNTSDLVIDSVIANKAANQWRYGRQRRRRMKSTHIDIVVKEASGEEVKGKVVPKKVPGQEKKVEAIVKSESKKPVQEKKAGKPVEKDVKKSDGESK